MGISGSVSLGRVRPEALFLALTCAVWVSFFALVDCARANSEAFNLVFALGAGVIAYLMLKFLGYFSFVRLLPRKSDLFLVLCAVSFGAALMHGAVSQIYGSSICEFRQIVLWTPFLSMAVFGAHFVAMKLALRASRVRIILCDVLADEEQSLREDFRALGLYRYFKLITPGELDVPLRKAALREVSLVVLSPHVHRHIGTDSMLMHAHLLGVPFVEFRRLSADLLGRIKLSNLDLCSYVLHATPQTVFLRAYSVVKVVLEPILAAILLVVLSPLALLITIAVWCSSRGSVLYRQVRGGLHGESFTLLKFRSMYEDAEADGPQWAKKDDVRVTAVGRFLRATRLDELPQLWNVIRGEMSFVGPRPERPELYEKLDADIPLFPMRTLVRPGITGWAQVCAGYASSVAESRIKLEHDLYYIQHMSPRLDLIVAIRTVLVLFGGASRREANDFVATPRVVEVLRG